jgi:hypothetical protein
MRKVLMGGNTPENTPEDDLQNDSEITLNSEILPWMTEIEQKIVKMALFRRNRGELLSIVEEVVLREYEIKLQAWKNREIRHDEG